MTDNNNIKKNIFKCPNCGYKRSATPAIIGIKIKCLKCGKTRVFQEVKEKIIGQFQAETDTTIPCPFCDKEISPFAKKCKHCGKTVKGEQSIEKKSKEPRNSWEIACYIVSIVLFLSSFDVFKSSVLGGLSFVVAAIVLMPPLRTLIANRINPRFSNHSIIRVASITSCALFVVCGLIINQWGVNRAKRKQREQVQVKRREQQRLFKESQINSLKDFQLNKKKQVAYYEKLIKQKKFYKVINGIKPFIRENDSDAQQLYNQARAGVLLKKASSTFSIKKKKQVYSELVKLFPSNTTYQKILVNISKLENQEIARKNREENIEAACLNFKRRIKTYLHDPNSYKHVKTLYEDRGSSLVVTVIYRAKNAFGALRLGEIKAEVDFRGRILKIISQD